MVSRASLLSHGYVSLHNVAIRLEWNARGADPLLSVLSIATCLISFTYTGSSVLGKSSFEFCYLLPELNCVQRAQIRPQYSFSSFLESAYSSYTMCYPNPSSLLTFHGMIPFYHCKVFAYPMRREERNIHLQSKAMPSSFRHLVKDDYSRLVWPLLCRCALEF